MAFVPTPQGVETVLKMTQQGVPVVNVYHFDVGHSVTLADLQGINAAMDAWLTSDFAPLVSSTVAFDSIVSTDISVANGMQDLQIPTTANGGAGGTPTAANAALVVSWRTPFSGRSFRGRTYIGGLTQTVQTTSHEVTTTYQAAVVASFQNLITALQTAGYVLSVLSKVALGVQRVTGILTEIVGFITNTTIDSQRRRTGN